MPSSSDSTRRFSNRVADYVRYRPGYPPGVIALLRARCALGPSRVVADIGSGTGIFTDLLLATGATVHALEPNPEMRAAAETFLAGRPGLHSQTGTAESTALAPASVDLITAAQAFHWFDPEPARREFRRILRPGGWIALIWNDRLSDGSPFLVGYEALLRTFATDYSQVNHRNVDAAAVTAFLAPAVVTFHTFPNQQIFDYAGARGRLLSSSYAPTPDDPRHAPMLDELRRLVERHGDDGHVVFAYRTIVHLARWDAATP